MKTTAGKLATAACVAFALLANGADPSLNTVWDGEFRDSVSSSGIYLKLNGNTVSDDGNTITIDQPCRGVDVNQVFSGSLETYETVIFRYRNLRPAAKDQVVVAAAVNGIDYDRAGFRLMTSGKVGCVWNSTDPPNSGGTLQPWRENGDLSPAGGLPERGYIAFTYGANKGASIHYRSETDEKFTDAYNNQNSLTYLQSINDLGKGVWGVSIGGCRKEPASSLMNASGMKITGIARINTTVNSIDDFRFASSVSLDVDGDEAASSINGRIPEGGRVLTLRVAGGVTIDLDEPFAVDEVYFASEGGITLSAVTSPGAAELDKFDFRAVSGGVTQDWRQYVSDTGEYLTQEAKPAFRGVSLSELSATRPIRAKMGGVWLGNGEATLFCRAEGRDAGGSLTNITYLAQRIDDGYVKAVAVEFTEVDGDVWARAHDARNTTALASFGTSFEGSGTTLATGDDERGYGLYGLALADSDDCRSISINFTNDGNSRISTASAVGVAGHEAVAGAWNSVAGENGTASVVNGEYQDGEAVFAAACGADVSVRVSGARGSWQYTGTGYDAFASVLRGYVDDRSDFPHPTVEVFGIPFAAYRVIVYCSTDTENAQFGYVTVNGIDYTVVDGATTEGTNAWGVTRYATPTIGDNVLVSDVTSGSTLTIVGNRGGNKVRGCIAAVQIVKCDESATVFHANITGDANLLDMTGLDCATAWENGEDKTVVLNNDCEGTATLSLDSVTARRLVLTGSGTTAISPSREPSIVSYDFSGVAGEVQINERIALGKVIQPRDGRLRLTGATQYAASMPFGDGPQTGTLILDRQMYWTNDDTGFYLKGDKERIVFAPSGNLGHYFKRLVLGNDANAAQTVEQWCGRVMVNGSAEPTTTSATVLLGHWPGTVNFRNLGGTFQATSAAVRLGWDGTVNWEIGDGASADGTAIVSVKGIRSNADGHGRANTLELKQGGTLQLGDYGIQIGSNSSSSYRLAGGILKALAGSTSSSATIQPVLSLVPGTKSRINVANYKTLVLEGGLSGQGDVAASGSDYSKVVVAGNVSAAGTIWVEGGKLVVASGAATTGEASLAIGSKGTLSLEQAFSVKNFSAEEGGLLNLCVSDDGATTLTVSGAAEWSGTLDVAIDDTRTDATADIPILRTATAPGAVSISLTGSGSSHEWTPVYSGGVLWAVRPRVDVGGKGTVSMSDSSTYVVTANDGETLTEDDFTFAVAKKAYRIEIAPGGESATVALKPPFEVEKSAGVADAPWTDNGEGSVTLNVEIVPGLYYAAASAPSLDALTCPGADSPASVDTRLVVGKPTGDSGFYKVWVSETPIPCVNVGD